jgi:hypothetical protein
VTRKQILVVTLIVIVASVVSATVAYRRALRQSGTSAGKVFAGCVDFHEADAHAGEMGCISGRVLRVYTSRSGTTFLDFCADYRSCPFGSVIFSSDRNKFGDLQKLSGQSIEIHGAITVYQGRAEIIIRDPEQIRAAP